MKPVVNCDWSVSLHSYYIITGILLSSSSNDKFKTKTDTDLLLILMIPLHTFVMDPFFRSPFPWWPGHWTPVCVCFCFDPLSAPPSCHCYVTWLCAPLLCSILISFSVKIYQILSFVDSLHPSLCFSRPSSVYVLVLTCVCLPLTHKRLYT